MCDASMILVMSHDLYLAELLLLTVFFYETKVMGHEALWEKPVYFSR